MGNLCWKHATNQVVECIQQLQQVEKTLELMIQKYETQIKEQQAAASIPPVWSMHLDASQFLLPGSCMRDSDLLYAVVDVTRGKADVVSAAVTMVLIFQWVQ